jgi:hypothetical protein
MALKSRSVLVALVVLVLVAAGSAATAGPATGSAGGSISSSGQVAPPSTLTARTTALPGKQGRDESGISTRAVAPNVRTFTYSIAARGKTYTGKIIGASPFTSQTTPGTTVTNVVIPVKFNFTSTGKVFDPTATLPSCAGGSTALARTKSSPIYANFNYGDGVGRQYTEAYDRFGFWKYTKPGAINAAHKTRLKLVQAPLQTINASGFPTQTTSCGSLGFIEIGALDNYLTGTLIPALRANGTITNSTFPLFLFSNVVEYQGTTSNCCVIGYHSFVNFANGQKQTYGVGDYETTKAFTNIHDVSALSHEVAEWLDDPYVNNATPPWGHTGQVSGCQSNLENGDPLSGHLYPVTVNGFQYHPQELAFFSWFFNQVPSIARNGVYSNKGTFTSPAALCS